jgi:hypothetical protein
MNIRGYSEKKRTHHASRKFQLSSKGFGQHREVGYCCEPNCCPVNIDEDATGILVSKLVALTDSFGIFLEPHYFPHPFPFHLTSVCDLSVLYAASSADSS